MTYLLQALSVVQAVNPVNVFQFNEPELSKNLLIFYRTNPDMHNDSRLDLTSNRHGSNGDPKFSIQLRSQQMRRKPRVLFTQFQVDLINSFFV